MKTITKNIHEEDKKFLELHRKAGADEIVHGKDGKFSHVIYYFPSKMYGDLADDRGDFKLPDMDYYNNPLVALKEVEDLIKEIKL